MGKLTIYMAIFNSYVKLPEGKLFYLAVFESERFSLKVVFRKGLLAGQWRWRKLPLLHDFGRMARWGCHRQKSKRIQQKERQSTWLNKVTLIGCCHIYVYTYICRLYIYICVHACINPCPGPTPVLRFFLCFCSPLSEDLCEGPLLVIWVDHYGSLVKGGGWTQMILFYWSGRFKPIYSYGYSLSLEPAGRKSDSCDLFFMGEVNRLTIWDPLTKTHLMP